jgi:type I restriction enzyme S subunit
MSLIPYPAYKDSGVAWLGQVPAHWELRRLGFYFDERREKVSDKDFQALSVTKNGIVPQLDTAAKTDDGDNRKKVCAGDFVINSRSDRKGSSGISYLDGSVSLINTVLAPRPEIVSEYANQLLRSQMFQEEFYRFGKGIVADLWSTNYSEMKNILLPVPTQAEQSAIAAFLDRETGKIDELIAEQEKLIALLAEKRQATISHAVTKGINPTAPMKDSNVEWLGQIPAHWEILPIKAIASLNPSKSQISLLSKDTEFSFLPMEAISELGHLDLSRVRPISEVESGYSFFADGDVAFAKVTPCFENGKGAVFSGLTNGYGFGTTELTVLRPKNASDRTFLWFLTISSVFRKVAVREMTGAGGLKRVPDSFVAGFKIALPPIAQRNEIVAFLRRELAKLDDLNAEALRVIDLLKERRMALISAAVTGKIDVRRPSAEIIDLAVARRRLRGMLAVEFIEKSQGRATFGRTALQKHAYLAEAYAGVHELGGRYIRNDYGPLDRDMIDDMESEAKALCGIVTQPPTGTNRSVTYLLSRQTGTISNELAQQLGPDRSAKLQRLHALLASLNTHDVEGVATLFAVWNDFLIEHEAPTDDDIVNGFLNDWNPKKSENFTAQELHLRLKWMRDHDLVPTGTGPKTETGRLFV